MNRGVTCSVETCRYHKGHDKCHAPVIAVRCDGCSSGEAQKKTETNCATFECK
ncbi:MAG: DUF1540 domain-containing protein [Clostridiales bacterium]|nr:DUF1540 domain-containing protein [Clostridiales bacterium]